MNTKMFSEAISEVGDRYYEEAARYEHRRKKSVRPKWGMIAACLVMAVTLGVGILRFSGSEDTVTLKNGETIIFGKSNVGKCCLVFDFDIISRDLTAEEIDRIFPELPVTAYAHFNASNNQLIGFEGKIGNIRLVVSRADVNLLDTIVEGNERSCEINGVPITAGYFVTRPNSKGVKTVIYNADFSMGNTRIYVENAGPEYERETVKNELADVIEALIDNGELDLAQY